MLQTRTKADLDLFFKILSTDKVVGYDVETNGLNYHKCHVIGYSVACDDIAEYIPVRHTGGANLDNIEAIERNIRDIVAKRTKPLAMHNGKFDSHFSLNHGIELGNNVRDTMIAACLLNENMRSYSLSSVGKLYPDVPQKAEKLLYEHISARFGVPATRNCMSEFHRLSGDDPIAVDYAKSDTLATLGIFHKQAEQLYGQNLDLVYDIENRLLHVLRKMERRGIHIDRARLAEVKKATEDLQMEVYQNIPLTEDCIPMNTRSNADLQEYFRMHEITEWNYTAPTTRNPNGLPSFNKTFLNSNEPGKVLVQARAIDNFINMFLNPIDNFIHEDHIHTNFNQTKGEYAYGTKTGRLSSNHPNMQQVPKRDEMLGRLFRSVFIARPGYTYVELDYSQAEPRLFSHYSGEPVLIHGYNSSPAIDMHDVAAEYMSITRKIAKNLNLGLQYAMGKAKLAASLGVDLHVATSMYQRWNKTFPKVREFTKKAAIRAEQRGFVKTILGRRARFDDSRFSYKAANRIVQGGAADILKFKMVQLDDWIEKENLSESVMMLLNIHDAVLFMIKDEIVDESIVKIKSIMEDVQSPPFELKVPFVADMKKGKTWAEASY